MQGSGDASCYHLLYFYRLWYDDLRISQWYHLFVSGGSLPHAGRQRLLVSPSVRYVPCQKHDIYQYWRSVSFYSPPVVHSIILSFRQFDSLQRDLLTNAKLSPAGESKHPCCCLRFLTFPNVFVFVRYIPSPPNSTEQNGVTLFNVITALEFYPLHSAGYNLLY